MSNWGTRRFPPFAVIPFTIPMKSTFFNTSDCRLLTLSSYSLNCLKASTNADRIAAGFADSLVKLWSVKSTKPDEPAPSPSTLVGHSAAVFGLDFSPDSDYLLSASEDKTGTFACSSTHSD